MKATLIQLSMLLSISFPAFAQESKPQTEKQEPPATQQPTTQPSQPSLRQTAMAAMQKGSSQEAGDLCMQCVQEGPQDREFYDAAVKCLEQLQRYDDCLDTLVAARTQFPGDLGYTVSMARVYNLSASQQWQETGNFDTNVTFTFQDSVREAKKVIAAEASHREARLILTNSLYQLAEFDKVRQHAEELVRMHPNHPGGYIVLGDLSFDDFKKRRTAMGEQGADTSKETMQKVKQASEQAIQHFSKAIAVDPQRAPAYKKLGDVYAWNSNAKMAVAKYGEALGVDPHVAVSHDWIAKELDLAKLEKFYSKAADSYRQQEGAEEGKAGLLDWYTAHALLNQAHAIEGNKKAKLKLAEAKFLISVKANAQYEMAYYYAMYSAWYQEEEDPALAHGAKLANINPTGFANFVNSIQDQDTKDEVLQLIRFLAKRGMDKRKMGSSRDLNHVLALITYSVDDWNNYALLCRDTRKYQESLLAYEQALEVAPNSGQILNDLAVVLHYHLDTPANLQRAVQCYERALVETQRVLDSDDASDAERELARIGHRDAGNNLRLLKKKLEKQ